MEDQDTRLQHRLPRSIHVLSIAPAKTGFPTSKRYLTTPAEVFEHAVVRVLVGSPMEPCVTILCSTDK